MEEGQADLCGSSSLSPLFSQYIRHGHRHLHELDSPQFSSPGRSEALTAEALVQIKDLVRRYPDIAQVSVGIIYTM